MVVYVCPDGISGASGSPDTEGAGDGFTDRPHADKLKENARAISLGSRSSGENRFIPAWTKGLCSAAVTTAKQ